MFNKLLLTALVMGLLAISPSAQDNKITEDSMKATKTVVLSPITIPNEMKEALAQVNQSLELARLKKENVILQLRLLLKVPNEFIYNEATLSFNPPKEVPKENPKESEKLKDKK